MKPLVVGLLGLLGLAVGLFLVFQIAFRLLKRFRPTPCPWRFAGILENPLRRRYLSVRKTLSRTGLRPGMTALEVGPGPGFLTVEAARLVGSSGKLYSLDVQPQMLHMVSQKLRASRIENAGLILGDATALPFRDNSLDLAFLVYVLGEIPDGDRALGELARCLKPGGVLSIAEVLADPDYSTKASITRRATLAGFETCEAHGNFLAYTVNFRKRYNFRNPRGVP